MAGADRVKSSPKPSATFGPSATRSAQDPSAVKAASSSSPPCKFGYGLSPTCSSDNPMVSLFLYASGPATACTFLMNIVWGDGTPAELTETPGPPTAGLFLRVTPTHKSNDVHDSGERIRGRRLHNWWGDCPVHALGWEKAPVFTEAPRLRLPQWVRRTCTRLSPLVLQVRHIRSRADAFRRTRLGCHYRGPFGYTDICRSVHVHDQGTKWGCTG